MKEIKKLAEKFKLSELFTEILYNRGFKTEEEMKNYLHPDESLSFSPEMFFEMDKAVKIIKEKVENQEKILIFGDYDVDGIFGAYILKYAFGTYRNVFVNLPSRNTGTRGLNRDFCERLILDDFSLVISVDNCISDKEQVEFLVKNGVDFIITDHHVLVGEKPNANAIIDPNVDSSGYPFKSLSGSAVAYKLGCMISEEPEKYKKEMLPLVSIATIADYMPLINENRYLVKEGMKGVLHNRSLAALYKKAGGKTLSKSSDLSFHLINILNSCGRVSEPRFAYQLLTETNAEQYVIEDICNKLINFNDERKRKRNEAIIDIETNNRVLYENDNFIITAQKDIIPGILGLIPITLMTKTGKNVISFRILEPEDGKVIYAGSARGVGNCNFLDEVKTMGDDLISIGGHQNSFGISIEEKNLIKLIECINNISVGEVVDNFDYDVEINISQLNNQFKKEIELMEPTGNGNPPARFLIKNASIRNISTFNNQTVCQIVDNTNYHSATYNGNVEIEPGWNYDVIIDSEFNILGIKKGNKVVIDYENGVDDRPLSLLGISNKKVEELAKKKIYTIDDLLCRMPSRYIDVRTRYYVEDLENKKLDDMPAYVSIVGTIKEIKSAPKLKLILECVDDKGKIFYVAWFYDWIRDSLYVGARMVFTGKPGYWHKSLMVYPNALKYCSRDIEGTKKIYPYYTGGSKPSDDFLRTRIESALESTNKEDYLESDVVERFGLDLRKDAFRMVHKPEDFNDIERGAKRMEFDELFRFALNFWYKKEDEDKDTKIIFKPKKTLEAFERILPYKLTDGQRNVLEDIIDKTSKGTKLNALLQADVGYGKTVIAIYLSYLAAVNGYQSAIMAPTKILARQHYEEFSKRLNSFGIKTVLYLGDKKEKEKKAIKEEIANGDAQVIIGTSGITDLKYKNIGVVVCDEQHKFGVRRRERISENAKNVHYLSMSATPIPRTIAESVYGGNITTYSLDEKPGNRPEIISVISKSSDETNSYILNEVKNGHQVYVVCPAIEMDEWSENRKIKTVYQEEKELKKLFADAGVDCKIKVVTGKTKADEAEEIMDEFNSGMVNVLVATTVVEVGMDVPNATLMVIKNTEYMGISQMHQLRGRVGRGKLQSYCIFEPNDVLDKRTNIVASTIDGLQISKEDALNRGYGNLLGVEQSGTNKIIPLIIRQEDMYKEIVEEVKKIINDEERFTKYSPLIKKEV